MGTHGGWWDDRARGGCSVQSKTRHGLDETPGIQTTNAQPEGGLTPAAGACFSLYRPYEDVILPGGLGRRFF